VLEREALPLLRGIADGTLDATASDVRDRCARHAAVLRHSLSGGAPGAGELTDGLEPTLRAARERGLLVTVQLVGDPGPASPPVARAVQATLDAVLRSLPPQQVTLTVLGVVIGILMGLTSAGRAIGMPLVSAIYPVPKIALLPLLILWLGIGETPKIVTIASGVFFPTVIAALAGVDGAPRNLIRMGQSFNLPMSSIIWKIILPSALPGILAGFRISVSIALILVVSAEMIGAQYGIGAFLLTAGNLMQSDDLMAGVVILSILGLVIGSLLSMLERVFLSWR